MATRRKAWRPIFHIGDRSSVEYVPHGSDFYIGDYVEIIDRSVRTRASDTRPNRYKVKALHRDVSGWLDEEDLERPIGRR